MILSAIGKPDEDDLKIVTDERAKDYVDKADISVRKSFK